ncbi:hypothetical protein HF086_013379 [Spodoptera exigua]|uniref:Odorant receptor n=1 Tax=Spodoptera exigua TaxID=7107 RepID=A0A922SI80_SPOEX|nr:hypothetical protein HF086_013379 [Spodoptera exigua]
MVITNDNLIIEAGRFLDVHQKLLKSIKIIVIMCYMFHFVNDVMIFIPSRTIGMDDFSTVSCVGMEPLSNSPNRQACMAVLALQELTAIVAVCSYDVALLFLFSHTTVVFQILYEDMTDFANISKSHETYYVVEDRLKNIVFRHVLALHTVRKLENIYSVAIGIGFGQRLTTASEKFEMAVYCCGWENLRVKERRQVLLMLKQAQKPVIVYAARLGSGTSTCFFSSTFMLSVTFGINGSSLMALATLLRAMSTSPSSLSSATIVSGSSNKGLEPLTASPNREICMTILTLQEFTINIVALNYQALLLFLIAHTAAMYQMMAYEMMALNDYKKENIGQVKKKLSSLIERHCLTLDVVDNLRSLYSVPLGVNFGSNAVCISLFFYLPLQVDKFCGGFCTGGVLLWVGEFWSKGEETGVRHASPVSETSGTSGS